MMKNLLLLATALSFGAAVADNVPMLPNLKPLATQQQAELTPVTPEGEPFDCYISFTQQGIAGMEFADIPVQASMAPDGSAIYFGNLFPKFLTNDMGAWTKGDIQADGTINIAVQYIYNYAGVYNLYVGACDLNTMEMTDITFVINADGSISQANPDQVFMLAALDEAGAFQAAAMYQTNTCIYSEKKDTREPIVLPEGVEAQTYIYNYSDAYKNNKIVKGQLAEDGNDVYFCGLTPEVPGSWVKGTKEGNQVTILPGQYLGEGAGYQLELRILKVVPDFSSFEETDAAVLTYDAEKNAYVQVRESEDAPYYFFAETLTSGKIYLYNFDFSVSYYPGAIAAKPAAPFNVKLYGFFVDQGRNCVYFENNSLGINGEYLEPENLYYQLYMDGEVYTLSADNYDSLTEDQTFIGWNQNDGKDIFANSNNHFVYVYDYLFDTAGAQIVYFVDGEAYCSDIVESDWEGNQFVTEVPAEDPVGIDNVEASLTAGHMRYYSLDGQHLAKPQQGINIIRINQADGSVKTLKTLVK